MKNPNSRWAQEPSIPRQVHYIYSLKKLLHLLVQPASESSILPQLREDGGYLTLVKNQNKELIGRSAQKTVGFVVDEPLR